MPRNRDADARVSVIIPTYNGAATLPLVLRCIRNSDRSEALEVIVCDDGSEDDIENVVEHHGRGLHLIYKRQERQGHRAAQARNLGIEVASGDVLLFIDDDVAFGPGFIDSHASQHEAVSHGRLIFGYRHRAPRECVQDNPIFADVAPNDHRAKLFGADGLGINSSNVPWYFAYSCNLSVSRKCAPLRFDPDFVGWGNEDIDFAYRHWRAGSEIICSARSTILHADQAAMSDPFLNSDRGRPANFDSAILNTVRMILKHPHDELLQSTLREDLKGFSIVGEHCVQDADADLIDDVIDWGRKRLDQEYPLSSPLILSEMS